MKKVKASKEQTKTNRTVQIILVFFLVRILVFTCSNALLLALRATNYRSNISSLSLNIIFYGIIIAVTLLSVAIQKLKKEKKNTTTIILFSLLTYIALHTYTTILTMRETSYLLLLNGIGLFAFRTAELVLIILVLRWIYTKERKQKNSRKK